MKDPAGPPAKPPFIAFEGGEGSGKSTHAGLLWERMTQQGCQVHEPGATHLGQYLRTYLKSR